MKRRDFLRIAGAAGIVTLVTPTGIVQAVRPVSNSPEMNFLSPSNGAKPGAFWFWLNGNVTKEGITLDLEAMQRAGLGIVLNFDAGTGIPKGPVNYLSDEWFALKAHAIKEANRLGLDFVMHNCPGWTSSGGPWITPELAMQELTWSETHIKGGEKADIILPKGETKLDYYKDIAVLAYPTPGHDLLFNDWEKHTNKKFNVNGPESIAPHPSGSEIDPDKVIDVSAYMNSDGKLVWVCPAGEWTILRLGFTPTGRNNNSAPDTGIGLECDKYRAEAIEFHFKNMMDILLPAIGDNKKNIGLEIDSWEVGMQNWTPEFEKEFGKRAGYDLTKYLPAMTGRIVGDAETTERFLWDIRRIQADMLAQNYYGKFCRLCHDNGLMAMTEPYDRGPMEEMQIGAKFDMCMGEFWFGISSIYQNNKTMRRTCKLAASIAHTNGKRYVGAESFTGEPGSAKWQEYPFAMKAQGDNAFTQGVNRIVIHRYAQQPHATAVPGMTMGAWGIQFDRTTTWWEPGKAYLNYLTRCQSLLQQGKFTADLAYFTGENGGGYTKVERNDLIPSPPDGYDYDLINSETLLKKASVENNRLVLPDGMNYKLLMLQNRKTMTLPLLRKLHKMVADGLSVVGTRPERTPNLQNRSESDKRDFEWLCNDLWGTEDHPAEKKFGKGKVYWDQPLGSILKKIDLEPDFTCTSRSGDAPVKYIHRNDGDTDIYFITNQRRKNEELTASFRISGKMPELWDPVTGEILPAPIYRTGKTHIRVSLNLPPFGSVFVVFRSPASKSIHSITKGGITVASAENYLAPQRVLYKEVVNNFTLSFWAKPEIDIMLKTDNFMEYIPDPWTDHYAVYPAPGEKLYGKGHAVCGLAVGRNGVAVWEHGEHLPVMVLSAPSPVSGWSHIALVYNDGTPAVYINGKFIAEGEQKSEHVHPGSGQAFLTEGASYYNGDMTDPEIHSKALDAGQLKELASIAFSKNENRKRVVEPSRSGRGLLFWENGLYSLTLSDGEEKNIRIAGVKSPETINGPWKVVFPPKTGAPETVTLNELISLHKHPANGVKYFSGTVSYRKDFTLPGNSLKKGIKIFLDLGQVEVLAEVIVNGSNLGILWTRPYLVDMTHSLRAGMNSLEIKVTNLWPNRLIGDEQLPDPDEFTKTPEGSEFSPLQDGAIVKLPEWFMKNQPKPDNGRITFTTWKHYRKDSPLLESGLVGPVTIRYAKEISMNT